MLSRYLNSRGVVLREVRGRLEGLFQFGAGPALAAPRPFSAFLPAGMLSLMLIVMLAVGAAMLVALMPSVASAAALSPEMLAIGLAGTTAVRDLKTILAEAKTLQEKYAGKAMPADEGAKFDALCAEAKSLQDAADRDARVAEMEAAERKSRRVVNPTVPDGEQPNTDAGDEFKAEEAIGYMTLGDYLVSLKSFADFHAAGRPRGDHVLAKLEGMGRSLMKDRRGGSDMFVPITRTQFKIMQGQSKRGETKAVPTLGANVIPPTRLPELVRATEHDTLRLRDVLNISRTGSNAVEYTRLVSYTRAADITAHGAVKPEATMEMEQATATVRTIAVHMPVQEQQLDDMPALAGLINGELLYDLDKRVEELAIYGAGTGILWEGIAVDSAVQAARVVSGDTLIDKVRRMITDVRIDGYSPNALLIDPIDFEDIVLEKGSDARYVWVVVTDGDQSRIWGASVVESIAARDTATGERNMIVGDWRRGATLWDRMDSTISTGWINDQFTRNMRTIRAELRAAFAVTRPNAFRKFETQAAS